MSPIVLDLNLFIQLTDEQFYQLCRNHRDIKFERSPKGELIVMAPVGGESGNREPDLITDLNIWNRRTQLGVMFSSFWATPHPA
ncbi:MAG: Uma2 family endonuclease [Cyanobacteria bacterium P01_A01_bin.114]